MVQKYSKGQILNNLKKKTIMSSVRDKYRDVLLKKDNFSEKKARDFTSGQNKLKQALASRFAHKSERQIDKILKNEMGMSPAKRKGLIDDIKGGGQMTKHQRVQLLKKLEKVKNRNLAMSRRQREEFAGVMDADELNPKKSQQKKQFRDGFFDKKSRVADDFHTNKSAYQSHGFAGSNTRKSSSQNTGSKLGGNDATTGLTGGVGSNSGGGGIKFAA